MQPITDIIDEIEINRPGTIRLVWPGEEMPAGFVSLGIIQRGVKVAYKPKEYHNGAQNTSH